MSRLIDADALTKNVLKWLPPDPCGREEKEFPFETDICVSMLMEIEEAPTIGWIPCKEELPKEQEEMYLVQTDSNYICQCRWTNMNHIYINKKGRWHWHIMDIPKYQRVVAWQPLPELYKGF